MTYNSYEIQAGTPGATFLESYHLTQTQCGPTGLVVVYGPEKASYARNPIVMSAKEPTGWTPLLSISTRSK